MAEHCPNCHVAIPAPDTGLSASPFCPSCGSPIGSSGTSADRTPSPTVPRIALPAAGGEASTEIGPVLRAGSDLPPRASDLATPSAESNSPVGDGDDVPAPGRTLGRYRFLSKLGEGGMGEVWQAMDETLARVVALKLLRADASMNEEALERFRREAHLGARLRHPNLLTVHDVGMLRGRIYLTMDLVEGRTLESFLAETAGDKVARRTEGSARLREEIRILAGVADAVGSAHSAGIIHRDLKPRNVLLDAEERPFVVDFGLAKRVRVGPVADDLHTLTGSGQMLGTPPYMAPEQTRGDSSRYGPPTDVWALGVMLYEVLTGSLPFVHENVPVLFALVGAACPQRPRARNPLAPADLEAICLKALEKEPEARYPTAAEFEAELRRWLRGEPVEAALWGAGYRAYRWSRRNLRSLVGFGFAAALLAATGGWAWQEQGRSHGHTARLLSGVVVTLEEFEDGINRVPLPPMAVALLVRQPLDALARLSAEDPGFGPVHSWRGRALEIAGQSEAADEMLERGCTLSPDEAEVWYVRGITRLYRYLAATGVHYEISRSSAEVTLTGAREPTAAALLEGLRSDLERYLRRTDGPADSRASAIAMGALALTRPEGADVPAVLAALAPAQGHPQAQVLLAMAHLLARQYAEAAAAAERARGAWPRFPAALRMEALAWQCRAVVAWGAGGDPRVELRAAITAYDRVREVEERPDDREQRITVHEYLGAAEEEFGRDGRPWLRKACEDRDRLARGEAESVSALERRATIWEDLGDAEAQHGEDPRTAYLRALTLRIGLPCTHEMRSSFGEIAKKWIAASVTRNPDATDLERSLVAALTTTERRSVDPAGASWAVAAGLRILGQCRTESGEDPRSALAAALEECEGALRRFGDRGYLLAERGAIRYQQAEWLRGRSGDGLSELRLCIGDFARAAAAEVGSDAFLAELVPNAFSLRAEAEYAAGHDPRPIVREQIGHLEAWARVLPRDADHAAWCAEAWTRLGKWRRKAGEDPRADLDAAWAAAERAREWGRPGADTPVILAQVWLERAATDASRGLDPRADLRKAVDLLADAARLEPSWQDPTGVRLRALREWIDAELDFGGSPAVARAAAEAVLPSARVAPAVRAATLLRMGRYDEARAALESERLAAGDDPLLRIYADDRLAEVNLVSRLPAEDWPRTLVRAYVRYEQEDHLAAGALCSEALAEFEQFLSRLPETERENWRKDPATRRMLALAHYNLACFASLLSTGRVTHALPAAPACLGPEPGVHCERAFFHLAEALRLGLPMDLEYVRADRDLAPLREDPRFRDLLGQGR